MIFSLTAQLAMYLLAPVGSVSLILGDWLFNAFLVAKVVENYVPNGPAIVGNISAIFPVAFNIVRSAMEPAFRVNYTGILQDAVPELNLTDFAEQMKDYLVNATVPVQ
jgi:hypothetical protein